MTDAKPQSADECANCGRRFVARFPRIAVTLDGVPSVVHRTCAREMARAFGAARVEVQS